MLATRNHLFLFSQIIHRSKYEEAYESLKEESISYINITQLAMEKKEDNRVKKKDAMRSIACSFKKEIIYIYIYIKSVVQTSAQL